MNFVKILTKFKWKYGVVEYFCPLICLVCFDSEQTNFLLFSMVFSILFIVRRQCFEISEMFIWCHYNCIPKSRTLPKTKIYFQKKEVSFWSNIWRLVCIYLSKINCGNIRSMCDICSKLTVKTPERRQFGRSSVFIVNFEQISHIILVFPLLTLNNQTPNGLSTPRLFQMALLKHFLQKVSLTQ